MSGKLNKKQKILLFLIPFGTIFLMILSAILIFKPFNNNSRKTIETKKITESPEENGVKYNAYINSDEMTQILKDTFPKYPNCKLLDNSFENTLALFDIFYQELFNYTNNKYNDFVSNSYPTKSNSNPSEEPFLSYSNDLNISIASLNSLNTSLDKLNKISGISDEQTSLIDKLINRNDKLLEKLNYQHNYICNNILNHSDKPTLSSCDYNFKDFLEIKDFSCISDKIGPYNKDEQSKFVSYIKHNLK